MSDIFISYARSSEPLARRVAEALRGLGYGVWFDEELPAHRNYADVIQERLGTAKAVVVIWCASAVRSEWVQSEADRGRAEQKLVQLRLDDASLPMPFDRIQCADLKGWEGDLTSPGWRKVVASLEDLIGGPRASPPPATVGGLTPKPSIAVVPFANLSNDPEQDYFADGMVEEIVGALARFKSLSVIAAGSGLLADDRALSPQEAARQLGVRYVLEGSVRKAANRARIAVRLVDARTGAEVWADRLEDTLDDIFALQDRVALRVAGALESTVWDLDIQRASARPTENMGSYDLYLRSLQPFRASTKADMLAAIDLLDRAIALDPGFALAISQSCVCHRQVIDHGWCDDPAAYRRRGLELADRALRAASDDAKVLAQVAASLPGLEGSLDRAIALSGRAIDLNPNSSFVWLISGSIQLRNGQPDLAAEHLETSMRLDPISTTTNAFARMYLASARFQQRRFDDALAMFRTTSLRLPVSYVVLASLYGHLGQIGQAQEALAEFRERSAGEVAEFARIWFPRPVHRQLLIEGLALAEGGVPSAAEGG